MEEKTVYYENHKQDFVFSKHQDYVLPEDYEWAPDNIKTKLMSAIAFRIAQIFGGIYCRLFLHTKVKNRKVIKKAKGRGFFLYGNHTQEVGDVFQPVLVCGSRRYFAVAGLANYGIPVIGKLLPLIGGLPIPDDIHKMKKMIDGTYKRIKQNYCVVIYPEAHVWPYCTFIRDFPDTSFRFPVDCDVPVYSMTSTYHKRKLGKKPGITIYVDGPFYCDKSLSIKEQRKELREKVHNAMVQRSKENTYSYIKYIQKGNC